jgi:hypothetical protein
MLQFEQHENVKFCQKLGKSASKMFHMTAKKFWAEVLCLGGTNVLHRRESVWKTMSISVSQEQSELNSGSKKLQCQCMPTASEQ